MSNIKDKFFEKLNKIKDIKSDITLNDTDNTDDNNISDLSDNILQEKEDIKKDESLISKKENIACDKIDEGSAVQSSDKKTDINDINLDEDTLKATKLIKEKNMDVIEALDHLDKMDEEEDTSFQSTKRRKMKEYLDKKLIPLCICFFITAMVGITAMLINMSTLKVSVVVDDDDPITVKQIGTLTTAEALHKAKIAPSSSDVISKSLDDNLKNNDVVKIKTSSKVLVTDGNDIVKVDTGLSNEKDIVKQADFKVEKGKKVSSIKHKNTSVYAVLDENQKLVNKTKKVKYKTIYKEVDTLDGDDEKVVKKGQNGKLSFISVVTTNDNGEVVKTKNLTKTVEKPVQNKVVEVAKDSDEVIMLPDANGKAPVKYNQKITVNVTAYCACAKCCGVSTGRTASGTYATPNRTIAAWSGLPFGTKVYFPSMANRPNGGIYTVEDRGGAIGQGRIDIYFSSHSEALAFGRRTMDAYILK